MSNSIRGARALITGGAASSGRTWPIGFAASSSGIRRFSISIWQVADDPDYPTLRW